MHDPLSNDNDGEDSKEENDHIDLINVIKPNKKSDKKIHKCDDCSKIFSRKDHLTKHQATHSGTKPFSCEV